MEKYINFLISATVDLLIHFEVKIFYTKTFSYLKKKSK